MLGEGVARDWLRAVQPAPAWTFIAGPGAMIRATVSFTPSTVSWPVLQARLGSLVQLELMTRFEPRAHPDATTYQSGSPLASSGFSIPTVRHGNRPMAGNVQVPEVAPSRPPPTLPAASGHGNLPGSVSPALAACIAMWPIRVCLALFSAAAL